MPRRWRLEIDAARAAAQKFRTTYPGLSARSIFRRRMGDRPIERASCLAELAPAVEAEQVRPNYPSSTRRSPVDLSLQNPLLPADQCPTVAVVNPRLRKAHKPLPKLECQFGKNFEFSSINFHYNENSFTTMGYFQ